MKRLANILMLAIAIGGVALADHEDGAQWSWHVLSGGLDESRVSIYRQKKLIGIFNFSCDLTSAVDGEKPDADASLQLVKPASNPEGLLVVTCNVGAHSQHIAIVDPASKSHRTVFERSGSYFVKWEIEDGELWISYDQACDGGPSVDCPDGFETIFEQYPSQP